MNLAADFPVTLVVKAANQRVADQTVECVLGWTIRKLKQHLETVYPSKPVSSVFQFSDLLSHTHSDSLIQ